MVCTECWFERVSPLWKSSRHVLCSSKSTLERGRERLKVLFLWKRHESTCPCSWSERLGHRMSTKVNCNQLAICWGREEREREEENVTRSKMQNTCPVTWMHGGGGKQHWSISLLFVSLSLSPSPHRQSLGPVSQARKLQSYKRSSTSCCYILAAFVSLARPQR